MTDTWQDKTDDTLRRIESQADGSNKQEGFAKNFREEVLCSLTSIKDSLQQNDLDHQEIKLLVAKIPAMELGLNNHLHFHDTVRKYVMYPIIVGLCLTLAGLFCRVVLKVL